jgi:uncharacterized membrane protein
MLSTYNNVVAILHYGSIFSAAAVVGLVLLKADQNAIPQAWQQVRICCKKHVTGGPERQFGCL